MPTFLLACFFALAGNAAEKPDILFIAIDDLNDYISPLANHPGIKTPHFERLAKQSVTFTNAHCAAPACHPSRVAVMTGVHPTTSGIYRNLFGAHGPRWRDESPALKEAIVLSQHFRDHGYRAAGGGKIFHTLQWTPGDSQNDPDAWDDYRGDPLDPISADWPRPQFSQPQHLGFVGKRPLGHHLFGAAALDEPEDTYGDHLVVDWAIEQMTRDEAKPTFLAVGLFRPHIPWEVDQQWFDLYAGEATTLPEIKQDDLDDAHDHGRRNWHQWVSDNDQWQPLMRGYLASISYVDNQLGRLLDAVGNSPRWKNTVIILWSDHGFHIGEKENWEKFALWQQTTRVPLFVRAPGISGDGTVTSAPVTLTDLYPTLCDLAEIPIPEQCDGTSLVPLLKDPTATSAGPALTSFQFNAETKPSHALSGERYRLIQYPNEFTEFYDTEADPNEFTNLANDPNYAEEITTLRAFLPVNVAPNRAAATDSPYHRGKVKQAPKGSKGKK
ncbi:sulfatase [Verrucomicrobiales bacterium]|nr:sulfatase [Verrucomicrobiales bacterium]